MQNRMKILVACEYSGRVRNSFAALGHKVTSCDYHPSESNGSHYQGDLFNLIDYPWDMAFFFPDCTHLTVSGARHFEAKWKDGRQQTAVAFFMRIVRASAHIPRTVIENPIGIMSNLYRKPDQIIQPWQFGHGETKATCLWLKGLPKLIPTNIVEGRVQRLHLLPKTKDRAKLRSKTYPGIAKAIAEQWSEYLTI
jgi:hypothetical protein